MPKIMLNGVDYSSPTASGGANKNIYGDTFVSMGRKAGTTVGQNSFAFGTNAEASGSHSLAFGNNVKASGNCSFALGYYGATSTGLGAVSFGGKSSAYFSFSEGAETEAIGEQSHAAGTLTTAENYSSFVIGKFNKAMIEGGVLENQVGDVFVIGNGTEYGNKSNALRITYAGDIKGTKAFQSSGADYAEFIKPWADGNPDGEDRVGYFVTIKNGFLHIADEGDYIAGIVSGNPSIVGNADEDYYWRYERDAFNRIVKEDVPEKIQAKDEDGMPLYDEKTHKPIMIETDKIIKNARMKLAEGYDPSLQNTYIERKDRKEWDYVGMLGVLPVRDDGTCVPGQFCRCGQGGIATLAPNRSFDAYMVIERISDSIVSVILK